MKLDLTIDHYQEIIKKSYSLDIIFLLKFIHEGYDITPMCKQSIKIKTIYCSLIRKGLITEEDKITVLGLDILDFISKKTNKTLIKKKIEKSDFDDWWDIYPPTDDFKMGHRHFVGTRGLRIDKDKCRLAFSKILEDGQFIKEDIIKATVYDVNQKKSNSLKKGVNQLTYIQNSLTYLNKKGFEPFIPISKNDPQHGISQTIGSFDI